MGSYLSTIHDHCLPPPDAYSYPPTQRGYRHVQDLLLRFVPPELAQTILDEAEYWPAVTCKRETPLRVISMHNADAEHSYNTKECYMITPSIPPVDSSLTGSNLRVRKVVFRMRSHDQGWGGDPGLTGKCFDLRHHRHGYEADVTDSPYVAGASFAV